MTTTSISTVSSVVATGTPSISTVGTVVDAAPTTLVPTSAATPRDPSEAERVVSEAAAGGALVFPDDIGKYQLQLSFFPYQRPSVFDSLNLSQPEANIFLPMPNDTVDNNVIDWRNTSLPGMTGYLMEQGMRYVNSGTGPSFLEGAATAGGAAAAGAISAARNSGTLGSIASTLLARNGRVSGVAGRVLGAGAAAGAAGNILQAMGLAENPFMTYQLNGPQFKTHKFAWKFMPRSASESNKIVAIIKELKKRGLPSITSWGGAYGYPNIVVPKFHPETPYMYSFKPCVLTNFTFDHTPEVAPAFFSGTSAPIGVVVTISLTEIELWVSNDFDGSSRDGTPDEELTRGLSGIRNLLPGGPR